MVNILTVIVVSTTTSQIRAVPEIILGVNGFFVRRVDA